MKSSRPKVLHPLAGRSLIGHVLATAAGAAARARRRRRAARAGRRRRDASPSSPPPRSSSTRTRCPAPAAPSSWRSPRCPRTSPATSSCSAATCRCWTPRPSPTLLARAPRTRRRRDRALRDPGRRHRLRPRACATRDGDLERIVEQKDATDDELAVTEVNSRHLRLRRRRAARAARRTSTTDNAQGEKYLTDVIGLLRAHGCDGRGRPGARGLARRRRQRPRAARRGRRRAERAHRARLAARRRHGARPGDDLDRRST